MSTLYPLRFTPIYKQYLWGGHRFRTVLGRPLEPDRRWAESWEVCGHGEDQSVVEAGPLAATTLHELVVKHGDELLGSLGRQPCSLGEPRFPLLLKYLDAAEGLSLQVHPDDALAAKQDPPEPGKTEAWVVVAAEPGSVVYAGLKPGVDRRRLAEAIRDGTCEQCVHRFDARAGDCIFVPAGTVHALGAGLLVAEIQQTSDTTFRLFDWNRVGPDGKPRALHVEQGLEAIHYEQGPIEPLRQPAAGRRSVVQHGVVRLVACDAFVLDRWELSAPQMIGGAGQCHILTVLEGSVAVQHDPAAGPLVRGRSVLLPASFGPTQLVPDGKTVLLDVYWGIGD